MALNEAGKNMFTSKDNNRSPDTEYLGKTHLNPAPLALGICMALGLVSGVAQAGTLTVPSGLSQPSPLFGATPFSARVVLFEEFGLQEYADGISKPESSRSKITLPTPEPVDALGNVIGPVDCYGHPNPAALDEIIKMRDIWPLATEYSQQDDVITHPETVSVDGATVAQNPWSKAISTCQPNTAGMNMPLDGRPYGKDFAHQRWNETRTINGVQEFEFQPKTFFQAVMAGARTSGGARDEFQSHGYGSKIKGKFSEFAPGGLYYNTVYSPEVAAKLPIDPATGKHPFDGSTRGIPVQIHPNMPIQDPSSVWTFDGTIPPKLLMARYGETILFRHHNALPIVDSLESNRGFGTHTISTHEHNGHNPAESDGFAGAFFFPGQYFDYRWPMILAGHDSINQGATDYRAATPCDDSETHVGIFPCETVDLKGHKSAKIPGDYRETMSTHWFHDHMLDFTAQNVYKGNAAMMNYYSAIDRGNEDIEDGVNLKLPSGTAKDWGNRDYDVNLVLGDKAFDQSGQLYFNPLITDGFLGDVMTVNWVYKPYLDVRARRYRFRILNGSVSRYMKIAVAYKDARGAIKQVPLHMIANDGNLLQHTVAFPNGAAGEGLPTQSIAERDDIIIDFAPLYKAGVKSVYLVNLMEHHTGAGPDVKPVALSAAFDAFNPANKNAYKGTDLAIGKFMEFRIRPLEAGQTDKSMNPADYIEGKKVLQPLPTFTAAELANAQHRTFEYGKKPDTITDGLPWTIATDGGEGLNADVDRISAAPIKGSVEIWHLINKSGGWSHPAHIHFEEGQIIARNGVTPPAWERLGRKDMYRLGPEFNSSGQVDVAIRVRDLTGTYVEHCHNTQHEDHAMLLRWDSEEPGHSSWVRTPYPTWYGAGYETDGITYKLPTADTGSMTTNEVKNFKLPSGWGALAKDVPATSVPAP